MIANTEGERGNTVIRLIANTEGERGNTVIRCHMHTHTTTVSKWFL